MTTRLRADSVTIGYPEHVISRDLTVAVPTGEVTVIVGPNACGKSTLLKALARMLQPSEGVVELDGKAIGEYRPKEVARILGLLPQSPKAPDGLIVADLVSRGRYPHQSMLRQWSSRDEAAIAAAMERARIADLADRPVAELSGGQRQRVWLAMVLAQETPLLLLDEPTTYLDITHQVEVLELVARLNREGVTVVMVLHELSLAFRYATNLVVMKDGVIRAHGPVNDVVTEELISQVYELDCRIIEDPETGRPLVIPRAHPQHHR